MIDVDKVLQLQESTVQLWHYQPIANPYEGLMRLVCQQHIFNFELWHQEDIARSPDVTNDEIADVKRQIDRLNQSRNDHIEKIDDWLTDEIRNRGTVVQPSARQNTETPGSAIDRLGIMALRIYHYEEQLERVDVEESHVVRVKLRTDLCIEQRGDLSRSLQELLADIRKGERIHKTYRQMKMYNDPTLNPRIYNSKNRGN